MDPKTKVVLIALVGVLLVAIGYVVWQFAGLTYPVNLIAAGAPGGLGVSIVVASVYGFITRDQA